MGSQRDVVHLGWPIAPSCMSPNAGRGGGGCGVSANEYSCAHGEQINFEDLTPYLTYNCMKVCNRRNKVEVHTFKLTDDFWFEYFATHGSNGSVVIRPLSPGIAASIIPLGTPCFPPELPCSHFGLLFSLKKPCPQFPLELRVPWNCRFWAFFISNFRIRVKGIYYPQKISIKKLMLPALLFKFFWLP